MHALSFFKSLNALEKMCVIQKERRKKKLNTVKTFLKILLGSSQNNNLKRLQKAKQEKNGCTDIEFMEKNHDKNLFSKEKTCVIPLKVECWKTYESRQAVSRKTKQEKREGAILWGGTPKTLSAMMAGIHFLVKKKVIPISDVDFAFFFPTIL